MWNRKNLSVLSILFADMSGFTRLSALFPPVEIVELLNDNRIRFRIGINSGVVVAGVVGLQKFHYDVWGDAVNFASRMESQGVAGKIQISRNTYTLIRKNFRCRRRGTVTVKGKGVRETWFLEGTR
jgi:adenylate cyclase